MLPKPPSRPRGRPPIPEDQRAVIVPTFRLPPDLAQKFIDLGGREWLIKQLKRNRVS